MSQSSKMNDALKKNVIAPLLSLGFEGKFPHYRKVYEDRIELLAIFKNKWGNSFTIEISTIYPQREGEKRNYYDCGEESLDDVNVYNTYLRYRLPGMFDGWFYYTDVYVKEDVYAKKIPFLDIKIPHHINFYLAVSEKRKQNFNPPEGYRQIQIADDTIYERICLEVNKQMKKAFLWWKKMSKK